MKNLPILAKSIILLVLMAVVGVMATGYMAYEAQNVASESSMLNATSARAALDFANAKEEVMRARGDMLSSEISSDPASQAMFMSQMRGAMHDFNTNMGDAAALIPDYAQTIDGLRQHGNQLVDQVCAASLQAAASGGIVKAQPVLNQGCLQAFVPYSLQMSSTRQDILRATNEKFAALNAHPKRVMWISLVALIMAIIVISVFSGYVIRSLIVRPLKVLGNSMEQLVSGDLSFELPETDRRDEIGYIAKRLTAAKATALERVKFEKAAKKAESEAAAERARGEAERAEASRIQAEVVDELANGLERLASGDFVFRISRSFIGEYEKLRLDFNKAIETLQCTMQTIADNAASVHVSAGEITQGANDLSHRTEEQAASLEQTATALDEITATVKKAAEGASEAQNLANEAKADAKRSGDVVGKTVMAMGEIEGSSKKISNIIGVIDEIAFQTNLLALNAGVEAARAGDAGRGFAVVATEVRALAQRSADAAKEIKALIGTSSMQVEGGVKLVNETGSALGRIVDQVTRLSVLVSNIASSSKEQSVALQEVNTAVNQMDHVTQQNAAMVEQSTAASYALSNEAADLSRLVGQFTIVSDRQKRSEREQASRKPVKPISPSVLNEAFKPAKPTKLQSEPEVSKALSKTMKQFQDTKKDDDDGWNEF